MRAFGEVFSAGASPASPALSAAFPIPKPPEAGLIEGVRIIPASSLVQLAAHLCGARTIPEFQRPAQPPVAEQVWAGHGHADDHRVPRR